MSKHYLFPYLCGRAINDPYPEDREVIKKRHISKHNNQTESQYDTYVGWKNRERQVMKGEHSEVNHLGERVFHVNQTSPVYKLGRRDRFSYPGGKRIAYTDFDPDEEDLFRLAYDPNY